MVFFRSKFEHRRFFEKKVAKKPKNSEIFSKFLQKLRPPDPNFKSRKMTKNQKKSAVIAFPGNNCEIETARAATRNGFETQIFRWNQIDEFRDFHPDFIVLPGGFSFEDRGRSGVIASRDPIFDEIRNFARAGKIILGICNGAQMIVESGILGFELALARNVRRDESGRVLGTGFFNAWVNLIPERKNTAFTQFPNFNRPLRVPIAHGEGRFVSRDPEISQKLISGEIVAFRYSDADGVSASKFPENPNGSTASVAGVVNSAGTICAMMPHPERFFEKFDGDEIFRSVHKFLEKNPNPTPVEIGDFANFPPPKIQNFKFSPEKIYIEKKLIITDNENFSVRSAAESISGESIDLDRTILFEISGNFPNPNSARQKILDSGWIFNPSKEFLVDKPGLENKPGLEKTSKKQSPGSTNLATTDFQNDDADHLAEQLSARFDQKISVRIFKIWKFTKKTTPTALEKILKSRLLANPNSTEIFKISTQTA